MTEREEAEKLAAAVRRYLSRTGYRKVEPKAALIDMDGTLYDSMGYHADAWHQIMTEIGVETTRDEFFLYEGRTGASTINLLFQRAFGRDATEQEVVDLYGLKRERFTQHSVVNPMPGAAAILEYLNVQGIRRILVTGSGQSSLINRLSSDFPGAFAPGDMITAADVKIGKPHPEPYLMGMSRAGTAPWESIVLENAPLGVESGAASKAFTIGVTTGPIAAEVLSDAGADVVFESMEECAAAMPRLFNAFIVD